MHRGPGRESLPATPAKTVGEIAGGMLNSLQVLRKPSTMGKLITNHAYLFIKQGLGEIQRGSAVFTSFNLQPVIKQNTAADSASAQFPPFLRIRPTLSLGVMSGLKQGVFVLLQRLSCLWAPE